MSLEKIKSAFDKHDERLSVELPVVWNEGPLSAKVFKASYEKSAGLNEVTSEEFQKKYPELFESVKSSHERRGSDPLLAEIHIAGAPAKDAPRYADQADTIAAAGIRLKRDVLEALHVLAADIEQGKKPMRNIKYVVGTSRLAAVGARFGFDVFEPDQFSRHDSHDSAAQSYATKLGIDYEQALQKMHKRSALVAVMSTEKFLELYGSQAEDMNKAA